MRNIYLALGILFIFSSCSKKDIKSSSGSDLIGTTPSLATDTLSAVSYLNTSYGESSQQVMDVYLPAARNSSSTPTIVIIHGGGWTSGDKADFREYVTEFQKRFPTYAIVNLNYRLVTYDQTYFPMEEEDVLSAVQFLQKKSSDYNISRQIILLGSSAGAHLAMLQGYKHTDVLQPKAIISFFGPTDLTDLFFNFNDPTIPWVLQKILGGTAQEEGAVFSAASPINYVNASSAPTLMLHGDKDPLVPINQAYRLQTKLDSLHVPNQLVVYPGAGHGWSGATLTDSFDKIEAFLKNL